MDAVKYLKTKARMTKECSISCDSCGFSIKNNGTDKRCRSLQYEYPEKAVEIAENWEKEHPLKTCAQVFFEKFPDAPKDENNGKTPKPCPDDCFAKAKRYCQYKCVECWDQKAPDKYQEWGENNGKLS